MLLVRFWKRVKVEDKILEKIILFIGVGGASQTAMPAQKQLPSLHGVSCFTPRVIEYRRETQEMSSSVIVYLNT